MSRKMVELLRIPITWLFGLWIFVLILFARPSLEHLYYGWLEGVMMVVACCAAATGVVGRLWASVYVEGYKNAELIEVGPYSLCRNPLYFFSFIGAVGVGFATETVTIPLAIAAAFGVYYYFVIKAEEKRLSQLFGAKFEDYKKRVPAFFPRLFNKVESPESWNVNPRLFFRRGVDAVWFIFFIGFLELVEALHEAGALPYLFSLY
ncbi:MAG: methyltransferase family protein [Thermoguttaceae bacterium]